MKTNIDEIRKIISATDASLDADKLDESTPFEEAGIDSLEMFNILLGVEEKYQIKIPDDEIENLDTIAKIIAYVQSKP